ncbi:hypothetical protein [uncultured Fluviicola sp.]|uniref:hypothetical protein n=1 Tax=uncultured Fluviicola sp. TaxID=463303 RepID=UPI0025E244A2|nr:hypothetical protein [uncultured Fluviicola sp.]
MNKLLTTFTVSTGIVLLISSCGSEEEKKPEISKEVIDPNSSLNAKFDDKIFSIPSPMQMAMLLEESKSPYNEFLLNDLDKVGDYTSEYKKAMNLGIYGTDLGYVSIYKQNSIALKYLSTIEKLTSKLGLEGAFDKDFMSRFEKNSTNKDSMMVIVSDAFKKSDNFLKSNNRKSVSALILVGGWIESMYLACNINKEHSNQKILDRIAEQTETLNTIIELLSDYNKKGEWDELIADMKDLKFYFDQITIKYEYMAPITNAKTKTTTLRHKTVVTVDSSTLNFINQKIEAIRGKVIE